MVAVKLPEQAPHRLTVAFGYLAVTMKNVIAHVDSLVKHLSGSLQQRLERLKSLRIWPPAVALIQPVSQQLRLRLVRVITRQHAATGHQIAFTQGADDPVVIDPFPAGFAHCTADRRVAATPQQPPLQFVNTRERKHAPAHLFSYQIDLRPHFTFLYRQQRRVIRERRPEPFRRQLDGDAHAFRQRVNSIQHVSHIMIPRRENAQHQVFIFVLHGARQGVKTAAVER